MSALINSLKQADIFYNLSLTELELVANLCQERTYNTSDIVFYEHTIRAHK